MRPPRRPGCHGRHHSSAKYSASAVTPAIAAFLNHSGFFGASRAGTLIPSPREQRVDYVGLLEVDANRGAVRAHLHARGPGVPIDAEIALGGKVDLLSERGTLIFDGLDVAPRTAAR